VVDGQTLMLPANRLVVFWAGVPHQLTEVRQAGPGPFKLCNIYIPLAAFLMMNHIAGLQVALLGGGMNVLPASLCGADQMRRRYADYRSGDFERSEAVKMEMNAVREQYMRMELRQASGRERPRRSLPCEIG
jgi:hypothetical protein